MGLKTAGELRAFCEELASDQPSPGGGSASAAAGAMAAGLLAMVCGMTRRSKKHEKDWQELERLRRALLRRMEELVLLSEEDAEAYDLVVKAARRQKEEPGRGSAKEFERSLKFASNVPLRTASECADVLECAVKTARMGIKSASSDVGVAIKLAEAGFRGAEMNVMINLKGMPDRDFVRSTRADLGTLRKRAALAVSEALSTLGDDLSA